MRLASLALALAALSWLAACLAGCGPPQTAVETVNPGPSPTPAALPTPAAPPAPAAASVPPRDDPTPAAAQAETIGQPLATPETGLERATSAAQRIAARSLKVARSQVSVRGVKAVVWEDAGLGCWPNDSRPPASTPGYLAMVEVAGRIYEVHMAESGRGLICPQAAPK